MGTTKARMWLGAGVAGIAALGTLIYVHRAMAEGIPSPNALYYSGVLEEAGVPVDGARDITVTLYADATTTTIACTTAAPGTPVSGGHFRVALPPSCTSAIHASPNANIEVTVAGEALPRVPIGAVPYAVEADHAVTATTATSAASAASADSLNLVNPVSGARATVGVYVGVSASTTGAIVSGTLRGYPAARALCDAALAGSHMCTSSELMMSAQLGILPDSAAGWFADTDGGYDAGTTTDSPYDLSCQGFTQTRLGGTGGVLNGPAWATYMSTTGFALEGACDVSRPILCCR